jgi:hypothetical protein
MLKTIIAICFLASSASAGDIEFLNPIAYSKGASDGRYVLKTGDVMSGPLQASSVTVTGAGGAIGITGAGYIWFPSLGGTPYWDGTNFATGANGSVGSTSGNLRLLSVADVAVTGSQFSVGGSTLVVREGGVTISTLTVSTKANIGTSNGASNATLNVGGNINMANTSLLIADNNTSVSLKMATGDGTTLSAYGPIIFKAFDGTAYNEKMRIMPGTSAGGFVGIGNTNPDTKLHISSSTIKLDGTGAPAVGYALCLNAAKQLSRCSNTPAADGTCTCI